ncbi:MAG: RluA family pseudouridine synthase [Patescibacteria group bacterium]
MNNKKILIPKDVQDKRLDIFLAEILNLPRSQAKKMIDEGLLTLNGKKPKKAGDRIKTGDILEFHQEPKISKDKKDTEQKLFSEIKIIKETSDFLIIDKPAGLLVHPTSAGEKNTLITWLLKKYPNIKNVGENKDRPGIVHRLDKEASGLLLIAKNQKAFDFFKKQFQDKTVEKKYKVLVYGHFEKEHDRIDFEIDRSKAKMVCRPKIDKLKLKNVTKIQKGKEALTEFYLDKKFARFSLLDVQIHSGRTHQIRVHMFASNHPVVGDELYLNRKLIKKVDNQLGRLFLQAYKLAFADLNGETVDVEIPLAKDLITFLATLKK